jgi:hypothetical protein
MLADRAIDISTACSQNRLAYASWKSAELVSERGGIDIECDECVIAAERNQPATA